MFSPYSKQNREEACPAGYNKQVYCYSELSASYSKATFESASMMTLRIPISQANFNPSRMAKSSAEVIVQYTKVPAKSHYEVTGRIPYRASTCSITSGVHRAINIILDVIFIWRVPFDHHLLATSFSPSFQVVTHGVLVIFAATKNREINVIMVTLNIVKPYLSPLPPGFPTSYGKRFPVQVIYVSGFMVPVPHHPTLDVKGKEIIPILRFKKPVPQVLDCWAISQHASLFPHVHRNEDTGYH
ncbi:putative ribonuclease H protein [Senna tora]|uniref:Putative ribonuclease H protein n=1 Tax=Senna tora TaxID=362788 RepID=A0A834XE35_9FABA|nr:putative ribonuclease H protein [Senna tora]